MQMTGWKENVKTEARNYPWDKCVDVVVFI